MPPHPPTRARCLSRANDVVVTHSGTAHTGVAISGGPNVYTAAVTGITGERIELPSDLVENVGWLRERIDLPICIGFGISRPEHVQLLAEAADGLLVGSVTVRRACRAGHPHRD